MPDLDVVTGAFSYTGHFIAERLIGEGRTVRTPSRTPAPSGSPIEAHPFSFDEPARLRETLREADVLYNTYWVRYPYAGVTYERAVANTRTLWRCAREVGVRRIVHLSVANADAASSLPYFRTKGLLERELSEAGGSWGVLRPTWIFGPRDILLNNIAWALRRSPVFPVPGRGEYLVQRVPVWDTARLAVELGAADGNAVVDAAGPEAYRFEEVVRLVRCAVGARSAVIHLPAALALCLAALLGRALRDVVLTREEIAGLMRGLLISGEPPRGRDSFRVWVAAQGDELGRAYMSELARNYR